MLKSKVRKIKKTYPKYKKSVTPKTVKTIIDKTLNGGGKLFKHTRHVVDYLTISNSTSNVYGSMYFRLVDVTNYTEYSNMYDQYRIDKVTVRFISQSIYPDYQVAGQIHAPPIYTYIDYDDAAAPASKSEVEQQANLRFHSPYKSFNVTLRPRLALLNYAGAVSSGYTSMRTTFVDLGSPATEYYGLKWFIPGNPGTPAALTQYEVSVTFYMTFKGQR